METAMRTLYLRVLVSGALVAAMLALGTFTRGV
jgi:hypothetical protein